MIPRIDIGMALKKIIANIEYRWKYDDIAIAGELYPTKEGVKAIFAWSDGADQEKSWILRKLRTMILGYGSAWSFRYAFLDKFFPWMDCYDTKD